MASEDLLMSLLARFSFDIVLFASDAVHRASEFLLAALAVRSGNVSKDQPRPALCVCAPACMSQVPHQDAAGGTRACEPDGVQQPGTRNGAAHVPAPPG